MRTDHQKSFLQGYACALSCQIRYEGPSTSVLEALECGGLTSRKILESAEVDPYDIAVLMPAIRELQQKQRRKGGGG